MNDIVQFIIKLLRPTVVFLFIVYQVGKAVIQANRITLFLKSCQDIYEEIERHKTYYCVIFFLHVVYLDHTLFSTGIDKSDMLWIIDYTLSVAISAGLTLFLAGINRFICRFNEKYRYNLLLIPVLCVFMIFVSFFKAYGEWYMILCGVALAINNLAFFSMLMHIAEYMDYKEKDAKITLTDKYLMVVLLLAFSIIVFGTSVLFVQTYTGMNMFIHAETTEGIAYYLNIFESVFYCLMPFGNLIIQIDGTWNKILTMLAIVHKFLFVIVFLDAIISQKDTQGKEATLC